MRGLFPRKERRTIDELNLVPVIDMFTTVVFFLLLSTSFIALNKLTIPPSKVSTITDPVRPPPLAPKLLAKDSGNQEVELILRYAGEKPDQVSEKVNLSENRAIENAAKKLTSQFHQAYPEERSIQIGLDPNLEYQSMIEMMDGARENLPDVVLISYHELER